MFVSPICTAVVEQMRRIFTSSLASLVLNDIQDKRPRMISLSGLHRDREFLIFWNRWKLAGEMVRDRMVSPCSHSPTGEERTGMPPAQTPMPILTSIARRYQQGNMQRGQPRSENTGNIGRLGFASGLNLWLGGAGRQCSQHFEGGQGKIRR